MIAKQYQEKMHSEINRRISSPEWDFDIASQVISKRNKKIKRNIFALSSLSLAATAAIVIFAIFVNTQPRVNDLNRFITKQIDGTQKEVFKETYSDNILSLNSNEYSGDPTDKLIDNALSMR